jgi:Flp pilus assembly protein TadG
MLRPRGPSRSVRGDRQGGQAIVLFALSLVGLLAMSGLVLDGGGAYVQRRGGQDAADLASVAGATAYANSFAGGGTQTQATTNADTVARQIATANGYTTNAGQGEAVNVTVSAAALSGQTLVTVSITKPHLNAFATVIGQPSWDVTTDATASVGFPNGAKGAMPVIFNERALGTANGHDPYATNFYNEPTNDPHVPKDVPQDETQFNWTVFCIGGGGNPCNGDSNTVAGIIDQHGYNTTVTLDMMIGPLNAGAHNALFGNPDSTPRTGLAQWIGTDFPVAVVDSNGAMKGWAMFFLTGVAGNSEKILQGYFETALNPDALTIVSCTCSAGFYGSYSLKLID